jgi:hypothetical protein
VKKRAFISEKKSHGRRKNTHLLKKRIDVLQRMEDGPQTLPCKRVSQCFHLVSQERQEQLPLSLCGSDVAFNASSVGRLLLRVIGHSVTQVTRQCMGQVALQLARSAHTRYVLVVDGAHYRLHERVVKISLVEEGGCCTQKYTNLSVTK